MNFNLSRIKNLSVEDKKLLSSFIQTGVLNGKTVRLGKILGTLQEKTFFDHLLSSISHISASARNSYLNKRTNNFQEFINNNQLSSDRNIIKKLEVQGYEEIYFFDQLYDVIDNDKKRKFLQSQLEGSNIKQIVSLSKRFPIVNETLNLLATSYEKWTTDLSADDENNLKREIEILHLSIDVLVDAIKKLKNEELEHALMQKTRKELLDEEGGSLYEKFASLINKIKNEINLEKESNQDFLEKLSQRRKNDISKVQITKTAEVFAASRAIKTENLSQPLGTSVNEVFDVNYKSDIRLSEDNSKAFFKLGASDIQTQNQAKDLEKLMWDVAGLFGLEDTFAPTKRTKASNVEGSVQTSQGIISLQDYISNTGQKVDIPKDNLIDGTLTTLLFGMYDAHGENIRLEQDGTIKFFDNTRSLPSSNQVIRRSELRLPYRSALLRLSDSYTTLSTEERERMKETIDQFKSKLSLVKDHFNRRDTKAFIAKLPEGWFSTEDSLSALEERLDAMKIALNDSKVTNLRDLVFAVYPHFKFVAALEFVNYLGNKQLSEPSASDIVEYEKIFNSRAGFSSFDELMSKCLENGLDPSIVLKVSQAPDLSNQEALLEIWQIYNEQQKNPSSNQEEIQENANQIYQQLSREAKIDLKDLSQDKIYSISFNLAKGKLQKQINQWIVKDDNFPNEVLRTYSLKEQNVLNTTINNNLIIEEDKYYYPPILNLYFLNGNEVESVKIDYSSKFGELKIGDEYLTVDEIVARYGS
jgi:hypothetical protein